jgi:antitoxin component of MazEF toxin-antitoxin module
MIKKLTRHGNSLALIIDKGVLDLLDITADTPLAVETDGRALIVSPAAAPERQRRFAAALARVNRRHGGALKRLAE